MLLFWMLLHLFFLLTPPTQTAVTRGPVNNLTVSTTAATNKNVNLTTASGSNTTGTNGKPSNCSSSPVNPDMISDLLESFMCSVQDPRVLISFGIGVFVSAFICCLVNLCCRSKQKNSVSVSESLEMVSTQAVRSIESGQQREEEGNKTEANGAECEAAGQSEPQYSDLDFSALRRQRAAEGTQDEATETEYAEIKRETAEEREQNDEGVKEMEATEDGLENEQCEQIEEGAEEEPLCQVTRDGEG